MRAFAKDQVVYLKDVPHKVITSSADTMLLETTNTGERVTHKTSDLLTAYLTGDLKTVEQRRHDPPGVRTRKPARMDNLSAGARKESMRRLDYLVKLDNADAFRLCRAALQGCIAEIARFRGELRAPHVSTIFRWRRRYQQARDDVRALFARFDLQGGKGISRLHPEVEAVLLEQIDAVFLAKRTASAEDVHDAVVRELGLANARRVSTEQLPVPSLRTVQRRLADLFAFELARSRYGQKEAERRFAHCGRARSVSRILELVEIDHTPVDLLVTNDQREAMRRPTLTVVLDRYSRCVLGYHLSLAGYGVPSVFDALRHALLPKSYLQEKYADLGLEWPCLGWFDKVLMDNGAEFHSNAVAEALLNLCIAIEFAASRSPNDKPHVERFLRTFNYSFIHKLPGTTLAKVHKRIGFNAEDEAAITLEELDRMIHVWICMVYHQRPHAGLDGRTPLSVWHESAAAFPPQLKCNAADVDIEFSEVRESCVQHYGIDLNTFEYNSSRLSTLRRMLPEGKTVRVKWPRNDVGHIWVWDTIEEMYFKVPNKDEQYVGMTLEQAKAVEKAMREGDPALQRTRADGKAVLQEMEDQAVNAKTLKERRRGARLANKTSKDARGSTKANDGLPREPLLAQVEQQVSADIAQRVADIEVFVPAYVGVL